MKTPKIILLFIIVTISSYAQVTVQLQPPPPYQFKVEQFWKIVLINNSDRTINLYLKGTATESLQGKIIEVTSSVIGLQPGVKTVSGRDLGPFSVSESNNRYKNILLNTGSIPSGSYDICVTVFAAMDGRQIASDCIQTTIENFNRMELIGPYNYEIIGDVPSGNEANSKIKNISNSPEVIFSWLPPVPVPANANINYRLKLVEILGYQSVFAAMLSNPLYYQSQYISATILRYPVAAKQMMPGRKYAWSVEAFIGGTKIQESEIRVFEIAGNGGNKDELHVLNFNDSLEPFIESGPNLISGLPSGLSIFSNRNYSTRSSNYFSGMMQNESDNRPIIKLYGDAKFTQESRSKVPQFSQLPANTKTLEINPRVSIWDIPFGMNVYLSSLNNSNRQSVNSVSFNFDLDQLKSKITDRVSEKISSLITNSDSTSEQNSSNDSSIDPNNLIESAEKFGLIGGSEKFFMDIKTLGVGKTYPTYSELTVNGVLVNGLNFEYNPGIFYLAVAAGNNAEAIDNVSLKRTFISGRLGLGKKENSHLIFTLMKMKNNQNNISTNTQSAGSPLSPLTPAVFTLTPQENVVFGTEVKLSLFNKLIDLNGEGAVSGFTRDLNDADFTSASVPEFVKKLIVPKLSTSFDYAWKGQFAFNNEPSSTQFNFGARRIGPGFTSLAAPNIRQDQLQYDINFAQKFANKKITLKTFFKTYSDNLIDWKQSTTKTMSYGINLGFNFPKLPFLQISYSPYLQKNDAIVAAQKMRNSSDMFSLTTGYSYQISNLFASTIFSFNGQWQKSKIGITSNDFSNQSYMINQSISFGIPLTLSSTLNISQSKIMLISSSRTDFDLNGNYQINEMISANLGGTISNEEHYTKKATIYFGSNITAANWIKFELQGNILKYKDLSGAASSYNDAMFQLSALLHW